MLTLHKIYVYIKYKQIDKKMIKTTNNIEEYKEEFGELYPIVQKIWEEILESGFSIEPEDSLEEKECPVGQCSDLEKILLTCVCYTTDDKERIALTQKLLYLIHKGYNLQWKPIIKIKRSFLIVIVEE